MGKLLVAGSPGIHSPLAPVSGDVLLDHQIAWDEDTPLGFEYTPCLAKILTLSSNGILDTTFEFAVIHTDTGVPVSENRHTLTANKTTCGIINPWASTIPTLAEFNAGQQLCILMIHKEAISDLALLADIAASNIEGKWPKTAGEADVRIQELRILALPLLRQVIQIKGVLDHLPPELRKQTEAFLHP